MNKITGGIHVGKYNAFALKCGALTAAVRGEAATLSLSHCFKQHSAERSMSELHSKDGVMANKG